MDKYYTKKEIVESLLNLLSKVINLLDFETYIEPSSGKHVFMLSLIDKLKNLSKTKYNNEEIGLKLPILSHYIAYDLDPGLSDCEELNIEIIQNNIKSNSNIPQDWDIYSKSLYYKHTYGFLICKTNFLNTKVMNSNKTLFLGNVPFGFNSSLARAFIKHITNSKNYDLSIGSVIAFVLPFSFKKESLKEVFPKNWSLILQEDLPLNSFLFENKDFSVPTVFLVFQMVETPTVLDKMKDFSETLYPLKRKYLYKDLLIFAKDLGIEFVKKENLEKSFAIQRVGSKAGTIITSDLQSLHKSNFYFIKYNPSDENKEFLDLFFKNLKNLESTSWVVGAKSISKLEFLINLNKEYIEFKKL